MITYQVKEFERVPFKGNLGEDRRFILTPSRIKHLRNLEHLLPPNAVQWLSNGVRFQHYCGVISIGKEQIEILPKITSCETRADLSREILIKMLYETKKITPLKNRIAKMNYQSKYFIEILIEPYLRELNAVLKQGLFKIYALQSGSQTMVRGRLLFDQQIKSGYRGKGEFYCRYDEFIEDNLCNQIIKKTLQFIGRFYLSPRTKRVVFQLLSRFHEVGELSGTLKEAQTVGFQKERQPYKRIVEMSCWMLSGLKPDVVSGSKISGAFLFDMNRLFEEYIAVKIAKITKDKNLFLKKQGVKKYLIHWQNQDKDLFRLIPDIVLFGTKDNKVKLIIDTKWKRVNTEGGRLGVEPSDIYQILAYSSRFQCKNVILVYPGYKEHDLKRTVLNVKNSRQKIILRFIDLAGALKNNSRDSINHQLIEILSEVC
ncbi:MAG: McrC family protein [Deltaproteobacteria bacterium]|nr:McrC family protein [Deltaproteobacteria bacterium]